MNTVLYLLVAALLAVVLAGILWWRRSQSARLRAQRKAPQTSRQVSDQPWEDDKDDGRGNR